MLIRWSMSQKINEKLNDLETAYHNFWIRHKQRWRIENPIRDRSCAIFCILISAEIKAGRFTNREGLGKGCSLFRKPEISQVRLFLSEFSFKMQFLSQPKGSILGQGSRKFLCVSSANVSSVWHVRRLAHRKWVLVKWAGYYKMKVLNFTIGFISQSFISETTWSG